MEIQNKKVKIRLFKKTDADQFSAAVLESIETVGAWMPWCNKNYSVRDAFEWIDICQTNYENGTAYDLGLFSKGNDLIGSVAINEINHRYKIGNIGFWVRESCQNQGYATEAVCLIKDYAFGILGLNRLEIVILESNYPSRAVAEKSGANLECIAKNRLIHNGVPMPAAVYSLVP